MPSKKQFNFGNSFRNSVNRGTPARNVVSNLASKHNKTESWVWNHLFQNGFVNRRKFNGSFVYWPSFGKKTTGSFGTFKNQFWQNTIEWAISSGFCKPEQIQQLKSQKDFFNFFGPFFARQFNWKVNSGWTWNQTQSFGKTTGKSSSKSTAGSKRRSTSNKSRTTSTRSRKGSSNRSYKFPKSTSRRSTSTWRRQAA